MQTVRRFGGIDVLANNAGGGAFGPLHEQSLEEIDRMLLVNVRGVTLTTRAVLPHLGDGARIINIGSANADRTPFPGRVDLLNYQGCHRELHQRAVPRPGPRGITINNVQPGPIDTEADPADGPGSDFPTGFISHGRFGHVSDVSGWSPTSPASRGNSSRARPSTSTAGLPPSPDSRAGRHLKHGRECRLS